MFFKESKKNNDDRGYEIRCFSCYFYLVVAFLFPLPFVTFALMRSYGSLVNEIRVAFGTFFYWSGIAIVLAVFIGIIISAFFYQAEDD